MWIKLVWLGLLIVISMVATILLLSRRQRFLPMQRKTKADEPSLSEDDIPWEQASSDDTEEEWIDLVAFPMDHGVLHPLGAQFVTKSSARDRLPELLNLLQEHNIAYRTDLETRSMFQAEKVQVARKDYEKAKELIKKIKIRPQLW